MRLVKNVGDAVSKMTSKMEESDHVNTMLVKWCCLLVLER